MKRTPLHVLGAAVVVAMLLPPAGRADGGRYAFAGGTPREQSEVRRALAASTFDWGVVPGRVTIHIERGVVSQATRGEIWLDADLLDAGMYAWGVVQHEYAHQVDFFLLSEAARVVLAHQLKASVWCSNAPDGRGQLGCERFASMLAWAYWPSAENCMRPASLRTVSPVRFRRLVSQVIGGRR